MCHEWRRKNLLTIAQGIIFFLVSYVWAVFFQSKNFIRASCTWLLRRVHVRVFSHVLYTLQGKQTNNLEPKTLRFRSKKQCFTGLLLIKYIVTSIPLEDWRLSSLSLPWKWMWNTLNYDPQPRDREFTSFSASLHDICQYFQACGETIL
jgi:hypothetical protein